jgi:hypothetical protein
VRAQPHTQTSGGNDGSHVLAQLCVDEVALASSVSCVRTTLLCVLRCTEYHPIG